MKEMIIVAGENKFALAWLRNCLRDEGYSSIQCETAEDVVEELGSLSDCGVFVPDVLCFSQNWTFPEIDLVCKSKRGNGLGNTSQI